MFTSRGVRWPSSLLVIILAVALMPFPAAAEAVDGSSPVTRKAQLDTDPALNVILPATPATLEGLLDGINQSVGRGLIILGPVPLTQKEIEGLRTKTAREAMKAIAASARSEWEIYDRFYLLSPPSTERHDARPVRRDRRYRELTRKIDRVYTGDDFYRTLLRIGRDRSVLVMLAFPGASPEAMKRGAAPCSIAARERTLDELMRALTALTGDPWEHVGAAHTLCFSGQPLSPADKQKMLPAIASASFAQSLTGPQMELLKTPDGLAAWQLSPAQRQKLAQGTESTRAQHGVSGIDQLVLRRSKMTGGFTPLVYLFVSAPGELGARPLGAINIP